MQVQAIENYKAILSEINTIIDISGYKNEYIARKLDIQPQYLSVKKIRNSFSLEDVEKILAIVMNEDVANFFMLKEMELRDKEEEIGLADFKKMMKW